MSIIDHIAQIIAADVCGRCNHKGRWAITATDHAAGVVVCGDHHVRCHAAYRAQAEAIYEQVITPLGSENSSLRARAEQAEARVKRLEDALRKIADHYVCRESSWEDLAKAHGKLVRTARAALAGAEAARRHA